MSLRGFIEKPLCLRLLLYASAIPHRFIAHSNTFLSSIRWFVNPDGRENHARNKRNKETVKERQTGLAKRPAKLEKDAEKRKIAVVVATLFITVVTFLIFWKECDVSCIVFPLWSSNVRYNAVYERTFRNNFSNFCLLSFIFWLDNLRDRSF